MRKTASLKVLTEIAFVKKPEDCLSLEFQKLESTFMPKEKFLKL
jgi:hypothetical protein